MKQLLNPRGYLSHTQVDMFLRNKNRYVRNYIFGELDQPTVRMEFGSKVALAMENGEETDDELINMFVKMLPRYPKREHEIEVPFKTQYGQVTLLGKLDQFNPWTLGFRETKTGVNPWTQMRADNHTQLTHYAAMIWLKHKKIPKDIHLDWGETEILEDGTVVLTGKIRTFEVKKSLADILGYLSKVGRVAFEIDTIYREKLKELS